MRKKHSVGLILILLLVLTLFISCFTVTARSETSPLTKGELGVTPMNRTGFIYNPYSVFVYYKGESKDGIIRFTDTIHYFNTFNASVSFTFDTSAFHENRPHTISLPKTVDRESYIFYAIPKTVNWVILPDTIVVESMYKGIVELKVEMNEKEAYDLTENESGGLISLMTATPSASQNIGGTIVTSVPAYKVFIVLLPEKDVQEATSGSSGIVDDIPPWVLYTIIMGIAIVIVVIILAKKLEYVEVEEKVEK